MEEILIEEYNYPLPDGRIAKYPLAERDQSKLLVYRDGQVSEAIKREVLVLRFSALSPWSHMTIN